MSMAKGKKKTILLLLILVVIVFVVVDCTTSFPSSTSNGEEDEPPKHEEEEEEVDRPSSLRSLDRQEIQLKKLQSLVENLTQVVTRLESSFSRAAADCNKEEFSSTSTSNEAVHAGGGGSSNFAHVKLSNEKDTTPPTATTTTTTTSATDGGDDQVSVLDDDRMRGGAASVTKYSPSWSERFQFLSAVKLDSEATCISVLPYEDYEGFSKYIAVGDEQGRVYVFLPNGDVLLEFHTLSQSPVTAMLSYMSFFKNETVLVTGHENGVILLHQIWEVASNVGGGGGGEDWHSLSMNNFRSFPPIQSNGEERSPPVTILEMHPVGRMRYILASDVSGNIRVLRENGTVYGSAVSRGRPLAFVKQRLLFLTENGAASLDLRTMKIRESECEGMNHSLARNYVFDVSDRSKAYGFTSEGDLIHLVLLGDAVNFKCRVRSKRKFEMDGPLVFQAIKGYLLVVSEEKVYAYNISTQHYVRVGAPRPLFFASLDEIRSSFLNLRGLKQIPKSAGVMPLITTDREKLIVLGLGSGYVGMYRSNLPVFSSEFNTMLWTSPVLVFLLFLFGVWHFFGKKKESLTSWGSEEPFSSTSVTTGALVGPGSGDRPFSDSSSSSRTTDLRDLRGGALRGSSRRYPSPSRYAGGTAIPFRPNSSEPNFRTNSTEHNFRAPTELKYRGTSLETTGFPKRREGLYPNSQGVEDNVDSIS